MRTRAKYGIVVVLGILALLLFGCNQATSGGGNSGGGATAQDVAGVLTAANGQLYRVESPLLSAGVPVPVLGIAPFSAGLAPQDVASWDCTGVTVAGDTSDPDNDGIPVNATYSGRCTWSYSGGGSSASGYWEYKNVNVQDPNSSDPSAGVKVSGTVEWGVTAGGQSTTVTWTINKHNLVKSGNGYSFDYQGTWTVTVTGSGTSTVDYSLSGTWTPDDTRQPWAAGTMNATGSFSGNGPSCANGWNLNVTLTNVHDNGTKIDGGKATFSGKDCAGNNASVTVEWSPSQVCVTVGGQTLCGSN